MLYKVLNNTYIFAEEITSGHHEKDYQHMYRRAQLLT